MSFSFLPSSQLLANGDGSVTLAAPTTTTTTLIPFPTVPSSSPQQPGAFFTGGASPPLIAGFISVGAFALAVVSICAWRKYMRRRSRGGVAARDADSDPDFWNRILPPSFRRRGRARGRFGEQGGGGPGPGPGVGGHRHGQEEQRGRRRWRQGRSSGRRSDDLLGKAKPEMFDAWIEKRRGITGDSDTTPEKWEAADSVPLSATLFTTVPPPASGPGPGPGLVETAPAYAVSAAVSRAGRDSVEEEDEEKRSRYLSMQEQQMRRQAAATGSSSTLRVAVLLQMPSPSSHTVITEAAQNDIGVRGELAIGLVEAPWTREHPSLRELRGEDNGMS